MSRTRLIKSVALMMGATLIGKALLTIREPIIAAYFGAGAETDAYNVAMAIVTMLLGVTISPIGSVLVPVYVERLHEDEEGNRFVRQVLTLYLLILSSVLLVAYFAAPWLVSLYAPGFVLETSNLAVQLTRILALFAAASGLAGYFSAVLTAHQKFFWVAVGPIMTAALVIVTLLITSSHLGIGALAWGMVAGNVVQSLLLWLSTRWQGMQLGLDFHLSESIQALGKLFGWVLMGSFIRSGNNLVDQNMLSCLSEGSIAALGFARSIYLLPFMIFTTGITRVVIADFSWDAAKGNMEALKRDLSLAIRMGAFFMIPVTAGLIVLRYPIVQLLYQRGAFDAGDAEVTATILMFLSLGLVFRMLNFVVGRVFTATKSLAFPTVLALVVLAVHFIANQIFIPLLGASGSAVSLTITEVLVAVAFLVKTRRVLGPLGGRNIASSLAKMSVASGVMALFLLVLLQAVGSFLLERQQVVVQTVLLSGMILVGGGCYIGTLYLLNSNEIRLSLRLVQSFLRKHRENVSTSAIEQGLPSTSDELGKYYTLKYYTTQSDGFEVFQRSTGRELPPRLEYLYRLAAVEPGSLILDVGCGRGEVLAEAFSSGAHAVGIDYSQPALELAHRSIAARSREGNVFPLLCHGDAKGLPFEDRIFDVVFILDVIEHLSEDELIVVLGNIARVLKPGGVCIVSTPNHWQTTIGGTIISVVKRLLRQPLPSRKNDSTHINLKTPITLRRTLRRAGFRRISLQYCTYKKEKYNDSLGGILRKLLYYHWGKLVFSSDLVAIARQ